MATYTKKTDGNKVQYIKDNKNVNGATVPLEVRNALAQTADGAYVDEAGERVETYKGKPIETDESEDEDLPTDPSKTDDATSDGDDGDADEDDLEDEDDDEEEEPSAPAPKRTKKRREIEKNPSQVPQSEKGMGYPRKDGKTLSIFSNVPHETVRHVAGYMVPLTFVEALGDPNKDPKIEAKTDAEILDQLKKMKLL